VEVRDSGPGVPQGEIEKIFEEYRTSASRDDSSRAGLGLAICRQIVDAHQGIVYAESKGQGANFIFILPYAEKTGQLDRTQFPREMIAAGAGS